MLEAKQKIKYLVADTTAFINAVQLNEYAENIFTVPDVMDEVKHKRQIRRLCVLPFDLQVRQPRPESVKHCAEFAKKTGDYASLSGIDIKVISLTYELEIDNVGTDHLRTEPVMSKTIASRDKPEEFQDSTKLPGWYNPKAGEESASDVESEDEQEQKEEEPEDNLDELSRNSQEEKRDVVKEEIEKLIQEKSNEHEEVLQEELEQCFRQLNVEHSETDKTCDILLRAVTPEDTDNSESSDSETLAETENTTNTNQQHKQAEDGTDDLDDFTWITPSNYKKVEKSMKGKVEDDIVPLVACMSTDFALQNVLKQMNLNVAALNGRIIKNMRTYILRCYACFKTTSIMTKVFCPNCGNKTLKRVAVSLDDNGKQVIHINTRRPLTTKYKNQALPKFRGGKHSRNPILFEDQPIPRQMPSRVAKTKTNALDEDYIAGYSPFIMRDVDSKSAMLRSKGKLKEWARNNTFEEDRRKKHYNRLYK